MNNTHNGRQKKMLIRDIEKLPIYQVMKDIFKKTPRKEIVIEILEAFSSMNNYYVDENIRKKQKKSLAWLNEYSEDVEKFIRSTFVDENINQAEPVNVEIDLPYLYEMKYAAGELSDDNGAFY